MPAAAVRRCRVLLAAAAVLALLPSGVQAAGSPLVVVTLNCPSGAVCDGAAESTVGLSTMAVEVACSTELLPGMISRVALVGLGCSLTGVNDGLVHFSVTRWTTLPVDAFEQLVPGLPVQPYRLCVAGAYQLTNGTLVSVAGGCSLTETGIV
jgi:hypothetical protein